MTEKITKHLQESSETINECKKISGGIEMAAEKTARALKNGNKAIFMGNGGSGSQSSHIAAEFVCKLKKDRNPLPAIALTTDPAILTSISNDYGFDHVFERQVTALGKKGDVAFILTTSDVSEEKNGHSHNLLLALKKCKEKGIFTVGLFSEKTKIAKELVDLPIIIPSRDTQHVQEAHITVLHIISELVEDRLF